MIVRAQVLELQNTAQRARIGAGFGSSKGSSESRRARAPAGKHLNSETFSGPDSSPWEGKKTIILHREQTVQRLISLGTLGAWIFLPYQKTTARESSTFKSLTLNFNLQIPARLGVNSGLRNCSTGAGLMKGSVRNS